MATSATQTVQLFTNVLANVPLHCNWHTYDATWIRVYYGRSGFVAVPNVDYYVTIDPDTYYFTVTPLTSLTNKIAALAGYSAEEANVVTVRRDTPRETDFAEQDAFVKSKIEDAIEKLTLQTQDLWEATRRSIRLPGAETGDLKLPGPIERADKIIGFDEDGDLVMLDAPDGVAGNEPLTVPGNTFRGRLGPVAGPVTNVPLDDLVDAVAPLIELPTTLGRAAELVQLYAMEPFVGFDNGTVDTRLAVDTGLAAQGHTVVKRAGATTRYFLYQRVGGASWTDAEAYRIFEYDYVTNGNTLNPNAMSAQILCGHGDIGGRYDEATSTYILYAPRRVVAPYSGSNAGKGFARIAWRGAATDQTDVTDVQLFGYTGSGHWGERYYKANVDVSPDGRWLLVMALDIKAGVDDNALTYMVYDREEVDTAVDPLLVTPVYGPHIVLPNPQQDGEVRQGCAINDALEVAFHRGYVGIFSSHVVEVYDVYGNKLRDINYDGYRAEYGRDELLSAGSGHFPTSAECEGLAWIDNERIAALEMDSWRAGCDVVTWQGLRFAARSNNSNKAPFNQDAWTLTTRPATQGAWVGEVTAGSFVVGKTYTIVSAGTTDFTLIGAANSTPGTVFTATGVGTGTGVAKRNYFNGTNYTIRSKRVVELRVAQGDVDERPIYTGIAYTPPGSRSSGANSVDLSYGYGYNWLLAAYDEVLNKYYRAFQIVDGNEYRYYDQRLTSDNEKFSSDYADFTNTVGAVRELRSWRARSVLAEGAGFNGYGKDDYLLPGRMVFWSTDAAGANYSVSIMGETATSARKGSLFPGANTQQLGNGASPWSEVFAVNGTINTSDERYKQNIEDVPQALIDAFFEFSIKRYKMKDAVAEKGEANARWHVGVLAQDVIDICAAHGIDALKYGFVGYDEWPDYDVYDPDTGAFIRHVEAGNRYNVRYNELAALGMLAVGQKLAQLQAAIT